MTSFAASLCGALVVLASSADAFSPIAQRRRSPTALSATWSDSKAVKEYQSFLESGSQEVAERRDAASVIVVPEDDSGYNPAAAAIFAMSVGTDVAVTPSQELPAELEGASEYPIYVALPPWEIDGFLQNLSEGFLARSDDLVFLSGGQDHGNIEDVLKERGFCRDSTTQFLVSGLGADENGVTDKSVDLGPDASGETKWAGSCAATGKWRGAIAERLERSAIRCDVDFYREWRRRMWEQSALDAIFTLVGAVREEDTTVAQVAEYYEQEASDMIWEANGCLRGWKAVTLPFGVEERLFAAAEVATQQPAVINDYMYPYIWGNRVFTEGKMFLEYLWYAREQFGYLQEVELPAKRNDGEESTIMRQGNLRADGVV